MRKRRLLLFSCLVSLAAFAGGGDDQYAIANIPAALLKNCNVVKRLEKYEYVSSGGAKATTNRKVAYTILNELGDRWANFYQVYDKFTSIESFTGNLYDAAGKKLKSLKKSDIADVSITDGLIDDNRLKSHNFYYKVYPYTVEYEVEIDEKQTMFLPRWSPQESYMMSVQSSLFTIVMPTTNKLRYKMYNYAGDPVVTTDNNNMVYTWEARDMPAVESEYSMPPWLRSTTSVLVAAEKFMMEDYEGSNASWKDFGRFTYDLKKNRDVLPEDIKQKVHSIADGLSTQQQKVDALYQFLQDNTRYVSIQLGIGGWQPFDAKYVGTKKYGDCKALSNFMYALLKEAGIRSVYTLVTSNDDNDYLETDFPSSQFNHVVLFVPDGTDTTWLECTSQVVSPGFMGGVPNRYALAVDESGGTLVRTPSYGLNENLESRKVSATIDETGNLSAIINTNYRAEMQRGLSSMIHGLSKDKLMEMLKENIDLPTYDINKYEYRQQKGKFPVVSEMLDLVASNYATVSGKRLFVLPNLISRRQIKLKADDSRKFDVEMETAYRETDSTEIQLPKGYSVESVPADVMLESEFGKYKASVKVEGEKMTYYRLYEHFSGRFPANDYSSLVKFNDAVYKADRNKVVLLKN